MAKYTYDTPIDAPISKPCGGKELSTKKSALINCTLDHLPYAIYSVKTLGYIYVYILI
jgi:hypothetical protein